MPFSFFIFCLRFYVNYKTAQVIILSLRDVYHVYFIIHSKNFVVSDWLQSPELFLITIWCLSYLENVSNNLLYHWFHGINKIFNYDIPSWCNNLISRCSSPEWIKKENSVHGYLKMKLLDLILTNLIGDNVKYIAPRMLSAFWEYLQKQNICLYPETVLRNSPKF